MEILDRNAFGSAVLANQVQLSNEISILNYDLDCASHMQSKKNRLVKQSRTFEVSINVYQQLPGDLERFE